MSLLGSLRGPDAAHRSHNFAEPACSPCVLRSTVTRSREADGLAFADDRRLLPEHQPSYCSGSTNRPACPDHEACSTGMPCSLVQHVNDPRNAS